MEDLNEIRRRKLEEMGRGQDSSLQEEMQMQQELQQLELQVKQHMSKEAVQRLGNIKAADPQKAVQLLVILGQLLQRGQLTHIDDQGMRQILIQITPKKKEFRIRKR